MRSFPLDFQLKGFLPLIIICLICSNAFSEGSRLRLRTLVQPTDDPFYTPPYGYESTAPGTILRSRPVPNQLALLGIAPVNVSAAYQLLYRSTDSTGDPQATVTTIIIPYNATPTKLLSFQIAEDSASPNCPPSYTLQDGTGILDAGSATIEIFYIVAALNQGWIVNVPDYEGPQAAFPSGIQAGQATLDSVRAALASGDITGISSDAVYQMWGYSGGSIASEWAAELAPTYAPELNFAGMAIGGLITSLNSSLYAINGGIFAGFAAASVMGLASGYPYVQDLLNQQLTPSTAAAFTNARNMCLDNLILSYAFQDMFGYFQNHGAALSLPEVQTILNETGVMGQHGVPQMPIFAYKAVGDEIAPINGSDALIAKLCSQGANIQYVRDLVGEHATETIFGAGDAFVWVKERFDGIPAPVGCTTTNVSLDALNPAAIEFFGSAFVEAVTAILDSPIGPTLALKKKKA